jgi:outer membrane receptor protein involved in Fe transport
MQRRALLNMALFYIDWRGIQQTQSFGGLSGLANAGDAESRGIEVESLFALTDALRVGANFTYTDATLESSPPQIDNRLGVQLPGVPEWTGSITADYSFKLFGGRDAYVGAGWRYVDERESAVVTNTDNLSYVLPSYSLLDLHAGVDFDALNLRFFVKNVTDERAYAGGSTVVNGLNIPIQVDVNVMQPRTIGMSLDVRF